MVGVNLKGESQDKKVFKGTVRGGGKGSSAGIAEVCYTHLGMGF